MCEANVYLSKSVDDESMNLILEGVDKITPEGPDTWRLVSIFGEQKIVKGRIKYMKLVDHQVVFESV